MIAKTCKSNTAARKVIYTLENPDSITYLGKKDILLNQLMTCEKLIGYAKDNNDLVRLSSNDLQEMPVLSNKDDKVIGIITISDLVKLYDKEVHKITKVTNRSDLNTKNNDTNNINLIKNRSAHSEK